VNVVFGGYRGGAQTKLADRLVELQAPGLRPSFPPPLSFNIRVSVGQQFFVELCKQKPRIAAGFWGLQGFLSEAQGDDESGCNLGVGVIGSVVSPAYVVGRRRIIVENAVAGHRVEHGTRAVEHLNLDRFVPEG